MLVKNKFPWGVIHGHSAPPITFVSWVTESVAVTVPSEALVGRLSATMLAATAALALALLAASRIFWRLGVRHYSGASA